MTCLIFNLPVLRTYILIVSESFTLSATVTPFVLRVYGKRELRPCLGNTFFLLLFLKYMFGLFFIFIVFKFLNYLNIILIFFFDIRNFKYSKI
jgi:hypothetical protein